MATLNAADRRVAWGMLFPWIIGLVAFIAGPVVASLVLAFTSYNVLTPPRFVGLNNFREMLADPLLAHAWLVTIVYGCIGTLLTVGLALGAALLLHHAKHFGGVWRTIYYFPTLLSGAAEGLIMSGTWASGGLVDRVFGGLGLPAPPWLSSSTWALPAVTLARYWTIGTGILLFLGARAAVSPSLYEAARVDGAGNVRQFWHVTLPMISPLLLLNLILGMLAAFQAFSQVYLMTQGGPGQATDLIGIYIYTVAFSDLNFGYGAAISWVLFMVLFVMTLAIFGSSRFWVHYQAGAFK